MDAVCHLAAALTTHDVPDDRFVDVNLRGTFNVLEAVRRHAPGIQRFIYTSSDAAYLSLTDDVPDVIDESLPLRPGTVYGATKVGAEMLCLAYWRGYGIPYAVMRPTATADPQELIDPGSVFGRRWFVSAAIAWYEQHPCTPSEQDLLEQLRAVETGAEALHTCQPGRLLESHHPRRRARRGGRHAGDDRAAGGRWRGVQHRARRAHTLREFVAHLGERLGLEVVEIRHAEARGPMERKQREGHASARLSARTRDVFTMIDEAVARYQPRPERRRSSDAVMSAPPSPVDVDELLDDLNESARRAGRWLLGPHERGRLDRRPGGGLQFTTRALGVLPCSAKPIPPPRCSVGFAATC